MSKEYIPGLIAQLHSGTISRREFARRAVAAGLAAGLVGQVIRASGVSAQEMPEATKIGKAGYTHSTDTSKGKIKLYSSWPLTGTYEQLGGDAVQAVQLCLEDFGGASGGYALEYEALDDGVAANNGGWEAGKETENVNKVINDAEAMVYMGTYNSGAAKISIPITNAAGMAQISYANTYPGLTKAYEGATEEGEPDVYYPSGKRNYMRVCPADDIQGGAAANWAYTEMERRKAYVLHDNSLYGKGVAAVFRDVFEGLTGEILGFEGYDPKASDYQALMTSIADKAPDIVMVGATVDNNAAKLLQDMRGVMSVDDTMFLGPDGLINEAFVQGAADAAEGAYLTFAGYTPDELKKLGGPGGDYVNRMEAKLGHLPDSYAVYAYETTVAVIQAIATAGVNDRTAILDALFATEGFTSLLGGTWSFTDTGDTDSAIIGLSQIVDGAIAYQKSIS
ncbi:MAG: branched-chain amino acid ABC transporter substrate-binding protein [Thermomicrobiales bacterium]|nr:branched-chain amino acid ABC transporter substrate-binding protein [Thermomicrobiales bacterium]